MNILLLKRLLCLAGFLGVTTLATKWIHSIIEPYLSSSEESAHTPFTPGSVTFFVYTPEKMGISFDECIVQIVRAVGAEYVVLNNNKISRRLASGFQDRIQDILRQGKYTSVEVDGHMRYIISADDAELLSD